MDWRKLNILEGSYTIASGIKATQYWAKENRDGFGRFAVIDGTINSVYEKSTKNKLRPSVCDLKLKGTPQNLPSSLPLIGFKKTK